MMTSLIGALKNINKPQPIYKDARTKSTLVCLHLRIKYFPFCTSKTIGSSRVILLGPVKVSTQDNLTK